MKKPKEPIKPVKSIIPIKVYLDMGTSLRLNEILGFVNKQISESNSWYKDTIAQESDINLSFDYQSIDCGCSCYDEGFYSIDMTVDILESDIIYQQRLVDYEKKYAKYLSEITKYDCWWETQGKKEEEARLAKALIEEEAKKQKAILDKKDRLKKLEKELEKLKKEVNE